MVVMSFVMMASQSGTYMNVCTPLLTAQYDWNDTEETLNKALMNTIPAVGTIFGSGFGSVLMGKGRARALIIGCLVGIFGSAFTLIEVWSVFLCAKFIVGASIGMTGVVVARFIEEYVPLKWFGTSQAISLAFLQAGIFLSTIIGAILPADDDTTALKENGTWRLIYSLQPVMYLVSIILFLTLVGTDTPRFYILSGQEEKAKQAIRKIY